MAKSNFLALCNKVAQECNIPGSGLASVTGQTGIELRVVTWTADADELIQSKYFDWNFLSSSFSTNTIADTPTYVAPTDIGVWDRESIYIDQALNTYANLKEVEYKLWRKTRRNGVQTSSKPYEFTIKPDNSLSLYPQPDTAYTLTAEYFKRPTRMTANTDTSDIPEQFEQAIIEMAKTRYAEDQGAREILENSNAELAYWVSQLEKSELPGNYIRGVVDHADVVVRPE